MAYVLMKVKHLTVSVITAVTCVSQKEHDNVFFLLPQKSRITPNIEFSSVYTVAL